MEVNTNQHVKTRVLVLDLVCKTLLFIYQHKALLTNY